MTIEQQIQELVAKLSSDPKLFAEVTKAVLSGKSIPDEYKTSGANQEVYNQAYKLVADSPEGREFMKDMVRTRQTDRFVRRNKPFFDAMLAGTDLATSLSQIRQSNKAIRELQKPSLPNPNVLDPALNNAISQAQSGNMDALKALEPAKQEIAQNKLMEMQTARSISGGQAGAYGARATAAGLAATRAADRLVPMGEQIRRSRQDRSDRLLMQRQGVLQNEFQNRMQVANANTAQYQADVAAAAGLGQAGRQNLRTTLGQLPEMITRGVGNLMPVYDQYGASVEQNVANRMTSQAGQSRFLNINPTVSQFNGVNPINPGYTRGDFLKRNQSERMQSMRQDPRFNYSGFNLDQYRRLPI
jgi:hypothetical protein